MKILTILIFATMLFANKCEEKTIDLKIAKTTIKLSSIIENIAKDCEYSIFYKNGGESIKKKKVGLISIREKTPNEILRFLLNRNNFIYTLENGVLTISKYKTKTFKVDYIDSIRVGKSNTDVSIAVSSSTLTNSGAGKTGAKINTTETFDFWNELEDEIEKIIIRPEETGTEDPSIVINKKAGFLTITGTRRELDRVEKYLKELIETLKRQVIIDVKIMSVTLDNSNKTGIDWSKLSLDLYSIDSKTNSFKTESNFQVDGLLNFLRSNGETRSLSSPKVLAMNNQPTLISIGDNINYLEKTSSTSTSSVVSETSIVKNIFIGVLLDITPQIEENGYITLRINPSISEFKYSEDSVKQLESRNLPPDTVSRRISSVVRVKNKETIILGGLINTSKSKKINKIWLLGDIPFIGWFFKSKQIVDITTEIVFILTPRVIDKEEQIMIKNLEFKGL